MDNLADNSLIKFKPDTLKFLRDQYNLGSAERLNEALDLLQQWIQKQNHLTKKDFSREYLERTLITTKGSVEKAKRKIDKICTFRTLMPEYFEIHNPRELMSVYNNDVIDFVLPKLTDDFYRVYILKNTGQSFNGFTNYFKFLLMVCEYFQAFDYFNGVIAVFDYREANVYETIKSIGLMELRKVMTIITEGYSLRLKSIHVLTESKAIDTFVSILKQAMSEKLGNRIHVHKDHTGLADYLPLDILPVEYGGKEQSLYTLNENLMDYLSSKNFMEYLEEMQEAKSDESRRQTDKFNDMYMGMPGSFRTLSVD